MSIFESKPQLFWRKVRNTFSKFFDKIGRGIRRIRAKFRTFSQGARRAIGAGSLVLLFLAIFTIFWLPMLQLTPEPETPVRETTAEAIERISNDTQRTIRPDEVPAIIEEIDYQASQSMDDNEILSLYLLRARVFFNASQFANAIISYRMILDEGLIIDGKYFEVVAGLFWSYTNIGDPTAASYFAARVVDEYVNGNIEDDGGCVTYAQAAGIAISVCPSIFDVGE